MDFVIEVGPETLNVTGYSKHVITDDDVDFFGVDDDALKKAVDSYFGQRPDDAFLKSPTPWGDLYTTYGWQQVQTVLQVLSYTVTDESSKPVALTYQNFVNNSDDEATYTASMSSQKTNSSSNTWTHSNTFRIDQKITYKINFGVDAGGETDLSYQYEFGESGTEATSITFSSGSSVTVKVDAHQTKHAILKAWQGQKKVRITYLASLSGTTAVNYDSGYKGHHYWDFEIGGIMSFGDISNSKIMTVDIALDFYSNSSVEVGDGPRQSG